PSCAPALWLARGTCASLASLRRPPGPTLFPYTTLFRSPICFEGCPLLPHVLPTLVKAESRHKVAVIGYNVPQAAGCVNGARNTLDRKSTRLNSSHQIISYAVFCLKKKRHVGRQASRSHA